MTFSGVRERVLFIGTQFSILYTSMYSPAEAATLGVKEREQAQKWYMTTKPSSSRLYGPDVLSAYYMWLRWNLTSNGKPSPHYKGDLVRKREEEEEEEEESEEEDGLFKFTRVGGDG